MQSNDFLEKQESASIRFNLISYIYGKKIDQGQVYYWCFTKEGNNILQNTNQLKSYKILINNYEAYHSRLIFTQNLFQSQISTIPPTQTQSLTNPSQFQIKQSQTVTQSMPPIKTQQSTINLNSQPSSPEIIENFEIPRKKLKKNLDDHVSIQESSVPGKTKKSKMFFQIKNQKNKSFGSFNTDQPSHISNHKMDHNAYQRLKEDEQDITDKHLMIQSYYYRVEWKPRNDSGLRRNGHYYTYTELKRAAPRILLTYLEGLAKLMH